MRTQAVLEPFPHIVQIGLQHCDTDGKICPVIQSFCLAIPEHMELTEGCEATYRGCQSALRHLDAMMFKEPSSGPQECNNFALKSIRGYFHDLMSSYIDGSILHENNITMNTGLCRWTQYVSVLSDATMCDPGSIIAMAGMLGFEACGVPLWELDDGNFPSTTIGRGALSACCRCSLPKPAPGSATLFAVLIPGLRAVSL